MLTGLGLFELALWGLLFWDRGGLGWLTPGETGASSASGETVASLVTSPRPTSSARARRMMACTSALAGNAAAVTSSARSTVVDMQDLLL